MAQLAAAPQEPFLSSQRIKDFVTLAFSTLFNPRSLEAYWYPAYTQTVSDLTNFHIPDGSLCPAERFYLYLSGERVADLRRLRRRQKRAEREEHNDDDQASNDSGAAEDGEESDDEEDGNDDDDDEGEDVAMADVSMETTETAGDSYAADRFPDIMLSHIQVVPWADEPPLDSPAYESWACRMGARAFHQCFPIIGELKRAPPRAARGELRDRSILKLLQEAIKDLTTYISVYFDDDPDAQSVIGICGAGPWWKWVELQREDATPYANIEGRSLSSPVMVEAILKLEQKFTERDLVYLGKPESDQQWTAVRAALIPILNAHADHYPPPPPPQ